MSFVNFSHLHITENMPTVDILALFIIVSFDFGKCAYNKNINFEEWFNLGKSAYLGSIYQKITLILK